MLRTLRPFLLCTSFALGIGASALAIAQPENNAKSKNPYIFNLRDLRHGLWLPLEDSVETLTIQKSKIKERTRLAPTREIVEPIQISVPLDDVDRYTFVERLAQPGKIRALESYVDEKLRAPEKDDDDDDVNVNTPTTKRSIDIDAQALRMIKISELEKLFARPHHHLTISSRDLSEKPELQRSFFDQIRAYLSPSAMKKIQKKISHGQDLDVDHDVLPSFARKMVKKFIIYRGPNCFQASLAFQDPRLPASPEINFNVEEGYHRSMINYDELWKALTLDFVEIDARRSSLKYGDILVFIDVEDTSRPTDYHWIKHAAVYLFDNYTFSKGSKSPNTPYSIKTIDDEWKTWQRFSETLGLKVFRRIQRNAIQDVSRKTLIGGRS